MEQAAIILFWIAFCGFLAATCTYANDLLRRHGSSEHLARAIALTSWLALTVSIGLDSVAHHGTPLNGPNQLVLIAWAFALVYFLLTYVLKFYRYGAALIPLVAALMFVAQIIMPHVGSIAPTPENVTAQMASVGVTFHVLLIIFGNAMLLISCVAAVLYLYQDYALRAHKNNALARTLPALANIERLTARIVSIGLPLYLAGQALGVARAIVVDATLWWADPRIVMSGLVLLAFALYLVLQLRQGLSAVATSWIAIVGGILIVALMIVSRTLPSGFHIFGTL